MPFEPVTRLKETLLEFTATPPTLTESLAKTWSAVVVVVSNRPW